MNLSKREQEILESIKIASENDPKNPEFPADDPKFPATPTYQIKVQGFKNVWLKDESYNPTGTHKDRMAWEMAVTYRDFLLAKKRGQTSRQLPQFSIVSSGSAAFAIGTVLKRYNLPKLKVLVDKNLDKKILESLKQNHCEIYQTDLSIKAFTWKEILEMTENEEGFDITSADALDPTTRFYDWLSYEIINNSPDYVFIPFGTGNLYENVLNINKKEVSSKNHDPRFSGDVKKLRACNFIGSTSDNPKTKADKLYSPHLPFVHFSEQWLNLYKTAGFCGLESDVHLVKEEYLEKAMDLATGQGVKCEYSGIAGLALMLQMEEKLPKDKKYLIVNTGKTKQG